MSREHLAVEGMRDELNLFADCRECGFDDFFVRRGKSLGLGAGLSRDEHETPQKVGNKLLSTTLSVFINPSIWAWSYLPHC